MRFTRNLGNIVMDLNDVERIDLNALGGADTTTVNDLSGTDVVEVNIDLAGPSAAAQATDRWTTSLSTVRTANDIIDIVGTGTRYSVVGLPALVQVTNSERQRFAHRQRPRRQDTVSAVTLAAGVVKLTLDGGNGDDTILGGQGADVLLGGDGNDFVDGDNGDDIALLGGGDDIFQWDPGDGNDVVEGQDGTDTLLFNGSGQRDLRRLRQRPARPVLSATSPT